MRRLVVIGLILGIIVFCTTQAFSQATYKSGLFAEKPLLEFKVGVKGGGGLQAIPQSWSSLRFTPGVGITIENNLFHFGNGMFDLGFMLDAYYVQKGAKWSALDGAKLEDADATEADLPGGVNFNGEVNADYIAIPFFVKFRYARGFDIGAGWLIPGIIAGFESNIFLSAEYKHLDTGYTYYFYDMTRDTTNLEDRALDEDDKYGFDIYTPGFQAGLTLSYLFDYGEITLEVKFSQEILPSSKEIYTNDQGKTNFVVPLGLDRRLSDAGLINDPNYELNLPGIQSQGIQFYLSYSMPFYFFKKHRVYSQNPNTKGYKGKELNLEDEAEPADTAETTEFDTVEMDLEDESVEAETPETTEATEPATSTEELAEEGLEEVSDENIEPTTDEAVPEADGEATPN